MRNFLFAMVVVVIGGLSCVPAKPVRSNAPRAGAVNVNTADEAQLKSLPGIGSKEARNIVTHRREHGPFRSVEDLLRVKEVGKKDLEQIRRHVVLK